MKRFFYIIYALIFHFFRLFSVKNTRVVLVSPHNADFTDSLGAVRDALAETGGFSVHTITRRDLSPAFSGSLRTVCGAILRFFSFFTLKAYYLATARYVFLNDNFMPLAFLHFHKQTIITQLWHAAGVFKQFGLSLPLPEQTRRLVQKSADKYSYVVCSSPGTAPFYAQAFGVPLEKVLPLGSARCDFFFRQTEASRQDLRRKLEESFPAAKGKKLVLYAPTFRETPQEDAALLQSFDFAQFDRRFGADYHPLVRLHPQIHSTAEIPLCASDVTSWQNGSELVLLCDLLITDYSSICTDFSLLNKPCLFFAYDLARYDAQRSFYFPYRDYVPGTVTETFPALLDALERRDFSAEKLKQFREFNFGKPDGQATKRLLRYVMEMSD